MDKLPEVYKVNILKKYTDGYELEPGVKYDEVEALILPKNTSYAINVVMDLGDNTEVDQNNIARVE
ncbi:hypothetical protein SFMTTN_3103 [Sulfuriferula multivorans]|uniref:Uncharacterized protein n=1 Tax=Sulfuriferula multivorans TaxID=1559896 RepID=A0A401JGZ6_9PROT|nr:hypothetical protein SFMTTN_3103 [Sulfuriferula multivorans]